MLILTRKPGESIVIGDNVTITVLGVRGNQVRLGVEAPIEISVHREEIYHRIQREKTRRKAEEAAGTAVEDSSSAATSKTTENVDDSSNAGSASAT